MRLYLIRHADPDYPNRTITPDGHLEAQALAERLAGHGLTTIYSSPLGRALDTMKYTTDLLQAEHTILDWTREMTGFNVEPEPWGSLCPYDVPGERILDQLPFPSADTWFERQYFTSSELKERVELIRRESDQLLASHGYVREEGRYFCKNPNEDKIAVFCHGGFGLTWLSHLLNLPLTLTWASFWLPPSSVTTILFDQRSADWAVPRCIGLGDVSHLYKANLPVKPRGILSMAYKDYLSMR